MSRNNHFFLGKHDRDMIGHVVKICLEAPTLTVECLYEKISNNRENHFLKRISIKLAKETKQMLCLTEESSPPCFKTGHEYITYHAPIRMLFKDAVSSLPSTS